MTKIKASRYRRIVICITIICVLVLLPDRSKAQESKDSFNTIHSQILDPIRMDVGSFIRQTDQKKSNCDFRYFSIEFIVNKEFYRCDSLLFSDSMDGELAESISSLIKKSQIDWLIILKDANPDANGNFHLILPVFLTTDRCPPKKFVSSELYGVFKDLLMPNKNGLKQVIILGSISVSSVH